MPPPASFARNLFFYNVTINYVPSSLKRSESDLRLYYRINSAKDLSPHLEHEVKFLSSKHNQDIIESSAESSTGSTTTGTTSTHWSSRFTFIHLNQKQHSYTDDFRLKRFNPVSNV